MTTGHISIGFGIQRKHRRTAPILRVLCVCLCIYLTLVLIPKRIHRGHNSQIKSYFRSSCTVLLTYCLQRIVNICDNAVSISNSLLHSRCIYSVSISLPPSLSFSVMNRLSQTAVQSSLPSPDLPVFDSSVVTDSRMETAANRCSLHAFALIPHRP